MPTEQREAIEGEEIHCSGAPTLEQYYQIQKLVRGQTGHRTLIAFHFMFLIFLVAFTGLGVLLSLDISSAVPVQFPIAISFVITALSEITPTFQREIDLARNVALRG